MIKWFSVTQSKNITVAIQGQAGSFHEQAVRQWYGARATIVPCVTFRDAFDAYANGAADAIVTAVENTIFGSINEVYQLIESCGAPIVGEMKLAIDQMLITRPGAKLTGITEVYSHPVALAQCQSFLKQHMPHATLIEFFDTAGAVEFIASGHALHRAAIAGRAAAELYGLPIAAESIQDDKDNITRFLVLESTDPPVDATRASLVVMTSHQPGALVEVLQIFARAGVNLTKLQSQPIMGQPWQYKFFIVVDCAGAKLRQLINEIKQSSHTVTVLGEYRAA